MRTQPKMHCTIRHSSTEQKRRCVKKFCALTETRRRSPFDSGNNDSTHKKHSKWKRMHGCDKNCAGKAFRCFPNMRTLGRRITWAYAICCVRRYTLGVSMLAHTYTVRPKNSSDRIQYASNEHTIQTYFHCVRRRSHTVVFCGTFEKIFGSFVIFCASDKKEINFITHLSRLECVSYVYCVWKKQKKKINQNKKNCENCLEIEMNYVKCMEQYI